MDMARILVIEDEPGLSKVLEYNLRQDGHECLVAASGAAGITLAAEAGPDLILLDWMLPDLSGPDVMRTLRAHRGTQGIPVVFVTARSEEADRLAGLELGAADYVVKPFSVRELMLRVRAVLRRNARGKEAKQIEFGRLRIDTEAHRVWVDGEEIELTLLEFKLLVTLHDNRDRVQSRNVLLDRVWGLDVAVTTRTVDTHVKRLRDKLKRAGDYVETVRGVGYRFAAVPPDESR
jgi:two-component system phosphate regulon response regulator PhoB